MAMQPRKRQPFLVVDPNPAQENDMKIATMSLFLPAVLAASCPVAAQSTAQLKQENAQLRVQLQALQAQCQAPASTGMGWADGALAASIDAFRIGSPHPKRTEITVTVRLRNTGSVPIILNYQAGSWAATDSNGYQYETHLEHDTKYGTVKGIPVATYNRADTSSMIAPGASRTVTFNARRDMRNGQTPGDRFDINATFVQFEDLGQGRIRKVRDFPVAFTNVAASGRLTSSASPGSNAVNQAANALLRRLTK